MPTCQKAAFDTSQSLSAFSCHQFFHVPVTSGSLTIPTLDGQVPGNEGECMNRLTISRSSIFSGVVVGADKGHIHHDRSSRHHAEELGVVNAACHSQNPAPSTPWTPKNRDE